MAVRFARSAAVVAGLTLGWALYAQEPKPPRVVDGLVLPPGTVIFVTSDPKAAVPAVDAVVLSPEEYRKLLASADAVRRLNQADQAQIPSACELSIKYNPADGPDAARVQINYHFRTERPKAVVKLGLQRGRPVSARYSDGELPVLLPDGDGLIVRVDVPGEYRLIVEVEVPVAARGAERILELGLPGAAITTVDRVDLPRGVVKARLAGRTLPRTQTTGSTFVVLGPEKSFKLTWEAPVSGPGGAAFTAESRVEVQLDERFAVTHAKLDLLVVRGEIGEFRVRAPATAKVTADAGATVEPPADPRSPYWVVRRPASAEDLGVEVRLKQPVGRQPLLVGAFPVAAAESQRGVLLLTAPAHIRINASPKNDATRSDAGAPPLGERREAFTYGRLNPTGGLAEVKPFAVRGELEVSSAHKLRLTEAGWRLTSTFILKPVRRELDRFDFDLPADLTELRVGPAEVAELVTDVRPSVRLAEPTRQPVTIEVEGLYPARVGVASAGLMLPRVLEAVERGGTVSVTASTEFEVRGTVREWDRDRVGEWDRLLDVEEGASLAAKVDGAPARVDLSWQRAGAGEPTRAVMEVHLGERQGEVRQTWKFPGAARKVVMRGPATLTGRVRTSGRSLSELAAGEWLAHPPEGRRNTATVDYSFPLAGDPGAELDVPMLWPTDIGPCEVEVVVWAPPGSSRRPIAAPGPWVEQPPRALSEQPRLPALCLTGSVAGAALRLRWAEAGVDGTAVIIDRAWIRADVGESAALIRARLLLRPTRSGPVIFELPGPAAALNAIATLDGAQVDLAANGWSVCARLGTDPDKPPQVFELRYQVPVRPGWRVVLEPPRPVVPAFVGPVRWQVVGPAGQVALDPSDNLDAVWDFGWDAGLIVPQPAWSGEALTRWFYGGPRDEPTTVASGISGESAGLASIRLFVVPRPLIRLAASLAVLSLGLLVSGWRWSPRTIGCFALAGMSVFLVGSFRPQLVTELMTAAEPGFVVLLVTWVALAAWRRRQQARSVFAPVTKPAPKLLRPTPASSARGAPAIARVAG